MLIQNLTPDPYWEGKEPSHIWDSHLRKNCISLPRFPIWFLINILITQFDDVTPICYWYLFLETSPETALPETLSLWGTPRMAAYEATIVDSCWMFWAPDLLFHSPLSLPLSHLLLTPPSLLLWFSKFTWPRPNVWSLWIILQCIPWASWSLPAAAGVFLAGLWCWCCLLKASVLPCSLWILRPKSPVLGSVGPTRMLQWKQPPWPPEIHTVFLNVSHDDTPLDCDGERETCLGWMTWL